MQVHSSGEKSRNRSVVAKFNLILVLWKLEDSRPPKMPKHYRPPGKKKEGNAAKYSTRSKALKHLQISLPHFRKLCILKGVFPREPKKKFEGNHKTYYHVKDITFLQHEPLLEKFRDIKAYDKKVNKARAKKNNPLAERLLSRKPDYTLDRLIRERYPGFIDALRDLDDCLTMVHLFAALPAVESEHIPVKRIHNCRRLSHEWQAYISRTHRLRKTFISVKGIYYQAEVEGQKITWLTPHAMQQVLTDDVDFKVMLTFLEFYETLLAFVNFRLYHSIHVEYPPILDPRLEALAADQYSLFKYITANSRASRVESQAVSSSDPEQAEVGKKGIQTEDSELRLAQLQHQLPANEPGALMQLVEDAAGDDKDDEETRECKTLFKNLRIFLSREVPRESLLFLIPAFGGVVSWEGDGAPFKETDEGITHQIVDRPTQGHIFLSREYVQPQWVYDCVNARIVLPTYGYLVGRVPPPHLSPFVDDEAEGYVPEYAETIKRLKAAAKKEFLPMPGSESQDLDDPQSLLVEGIISRTEATEAAEKKRKIDVLEKQYHDELKMELDRVPYSAALSKKNLNVEDKEESLPDQDQKAVDDAMFMVTETRKKRGLYKAMQKGKEKKMAHVNLLKERKKKAESAKSP
ncbi:BRCT domain [Macleaya cordata]|uniref:Pescadillo homolog n=1 Tax=Macleaya cordata TaxID=56857 RepID=A0A200RCJ7_MACCD|nr:BRCT domain [Macleaya cordata]